MAFVRRPTGPHRRADAVPGVHDRARRVDRHRQHRRRRDRDRLRRARARSSGSGSTASSRWRSSSPRRCSGSSSARSRGTTVLSGPMYYLRDGLKSPALAWIFALVAAVAALTTTPFTQPNSIALVVNSVFGVPKLAVGIVVAVLTWLVIIGGIKSIGRAAEKLSPLKVGLYLAGGLIVIVLQRREDPRRARARLPRGVHDAVGARVRRVHRDALRHRARHLRQRSRLRHRGGRLRHRAEHAAGAAGAERGHRGVHRVVRAPRRSAR